MNKALLLTTMTIGLAGLPAFAGDRGPSGSGAQFGFGISFGGPSGGYYADPGPGMYYVDRGGGYYYDDYGYARGPRYDKGHKRHEKYMRQQERFYRNSYRRGERYDSRGYKSYYRQDGRW